MLDGETIRRIRSYDLRQLVEQDGRRLYAAGPHRFLAQCVFHNDRDPSLAIYTDPDDQHYFCFACGARGDAVTYVRARGQAWTWNDSLIYLGIRQGIRRALPAALPAPRFDPDTEAWLDGAPDNIFPYCDERGELIYEVLRWDNPSGSKTFRQRRPDGRGGYIRNLRGVARQLYHADRLARLAPGSLIAICEGEKCVEAFWALDQPATTVSGGAKGVWNADIMSVLAGHDLLICPDGDAPGEEWLKACLAAVLPSARRLRIVRLPGLPAGGDIVDFLDAGHTLADFYDLARRAHTVPRTGIEREDDTAAEGGLLGMLLQAPARVAALPSGWDLARYLTVPANQALYTAIVACLRDHGRVDDHLLAQALAPLPQDLRIEIRYRAAEYMQPYYPPEELAGYVAELDAAAERRAAVARSRQLADLASDRSLDAPALRQAQLRVIAPAAAHGASTRGVLRPIADGIPAFREHLADIRARPGIRIELPSGFWELDARSGGLHPGELTFLASRPSVGKSALLMACARAMARRGRVALFSLEMTGKMLLNRLACQVAHVDLNHLIKADLTAGEVARLAAAADEIERLPILYSDGVLTSVEEAILRVRLEHARDPLAVAMIDYLGLLSLDDSAARRNQYERVSELARRAQRGARDLEIPFLVAVQMSRAVEQRDDKEPKISDLVDSGALEAAADSIWFLQRQTRLSAADEDGVEQSGRPLPADQDPRRLATLIIAKQRNGPTGRVKLWYDLESTGFYPLTRNPPTYPYSLPGHPENRSPAPAVGEAVAP